MDSSQLPCSWNIAFVLVILTVLLPGCIRKTEILSSQCKIPRVSDMTGVLTARVNPNSSICLIVANETLFGPPMYVIAQCPFLKEESLTDGDFGFYRLPPGDYMVVTPHEAFREDSQTTGGYDLFNSSVRVNICGAGKKPKNSYLRRPFWFMRSALWPRS